MPRPGLREHLAVSLVDGRFKCIASQTATDAVYHSAYRYGSSWKKTAALAAVTEAALAVAMYFGKPDDPGHVAFAGFLAVDALGTVAIAFIPRKEIYSEQSVAVTTPVRDVCPDGLSVQITGEVYPINAAGAIGELGEASLAEWMRGGSNAELTIDFEGRTSPLRSDGLVRAAVFDVEPGTLAATP